MRLLHECTTRLPTGVVSMFAAAAVSLTPLPHACLAASPTPEAQAVLRKGFTAAQAGLYARADGLLSQSIAEWEKTKQPPDEVAALYKTRGGIRKEASRLDEARQDLSRALALYDAPGSRPDPAEVQRTYQLRARVNAALGAKRAQIDDLSAAISRLDTLDAIEATNPYLFSERGRARMAVGEYGGATEDLELAEIQFKEIGDKIRRTIAAADGAIASYGAGELEAAVEKMRYVFRSRGIPASNNPDDIPLLQELTLKDAELHVAYAAHLYGTQSKLLEASRQWEAGCIRLDTYVIDGQERLAAEQQLRAQEAREAEATGREAKALRAESVRSQPLGALTPNSDLNARLNGLDPSNPYVTQRPGSSYFWYKTGEGEVERRDAGNELARVDPSLSCVAFRDAGWVAENRPEWPPNLRQSLRRWADEVPQRPYVLPPKGSPPSRGEVEF